MTSEEEKWNIFYSKKVEIQKQLTSQMVIEFCIEQGYIENDKDNDKLSEEIYNAYWKNKKII